MDIEAACKELEGIATIFEYSQSQVFAADLAGVLLDVNENRITYVQGNYKLRVSATPFCIRRMVDRLRKGFKANPIPSSRSRVSLKRAKYSEKLYQQFIEDGELENAEAYRALYQEAK